MQWARCRRPRSGKPTRTSIADSLTKPSGGVGEDCIDLSGVGQEIGPPLRPVAIALTDLRQEALEFLDIAGCRIAELRVGAKAAPNLVERLLAGLGVEPARYGARLAAAPPIPHLHRGLVVDETGDFPVQRLERLRVSVRGLLRFVAGGGRKQIRKPPRLSTIRCRRRAGRPSDHARPGGRGCWPRLPQGARERSAGLRYADPIQRLALDG